MIEFNMLVYYKIRINSKPYNDVNVSVFRKNMHSTHFFLQCRNPYSPHKSRKKVFCWNCLNIPHNSRKNGIVFKLFKYTRYHIHMTSEKSSKGVIYSLWKVVWKSWNPNILQWNKHCSRYVMEGQPYRFNSAILIQFIGRTAKDLQRTNLDVDTLVTH